MFLFVVFLVIFCFVIAISSTFFLLRDRFIFIQMYATKEAAPDLLNKLDFEAMRDIAFLVLGNFFLLLFGIILYKNIRVRQNVSKQKNKIKEAAPKASDMDDAPPKKP